MNKIEEEFQLWLKIAYQEKIPKMSVSQYADLRNTFYVGVSSAILHHDHEHCEESIALLKDAVLTHIEELVTAERGKGDTK